MTTQGIVQILSTVGVTIALAIPLGAYMARVYQGQATLARRVVGPIERLLYRAAGVREDDDTPWTRYALALLVFNALGLVVVYALQRLQAALPLDPTHVPGVPPAVAFNTAVSFVTNTNWQAYAGESTMSHLTQLAALTVQNFVSAATGMAVLVALIRGFARRSSAAVGSFWVDLVRSTLYVLLPLSIVLAVALISQGVVQTLAGSVTAGDQTIALGPVASQVAIKQLGTNGGGFFNANAAHPFENPTALANLLELGAILVIPAGLCVTFGRMIGDRRQGWALLATMLAIFVPILIATYAAEQAGNPALHGLGVVGGNMEGKEARFGVAQSATWAVATTAASNGSVNAMLDSFTPLGGLGPLWLIQLGEIVFGGVGSGLYGLLVYAIIAVFVAGLMVGRTPEYLGKKLEVFEMKMAALVVLLPAAAVLVGTAIACATTAGTAPRGNPGAHGFTEILYAFSSGANNNGSAFGGLTVSGTFYAVAIAIVMLIGRFGVIVPVLALAGALARKPVIPPSSGTLPTHGTLFVALLAGTIVLVGALTFIPSLALGPIVEHLSLSSAGGAP